jgi:biotin synthase-like enzyme
LGFSRHPWTLKKQLAQLRCGLYRCHHNLETSEAFSVKYVQLIRTGKIKTMRLQIAGTFQYAAARAFGLSETWEDRIDTALQLKINIESVPKFLTSKVRWNSTLLSPLEALKIIAV